MISTKSTSLAGVTQGATMLSGKRKRLLVLAGLFVACLDLLSSNVSIRADSAIRARTQSAMQQSPTETPLAPCKQGKVSLDARQIHAEIDKIYPYYLTFATDPGIIDFSGKPDCTGRRVYTVDLAVPDHSSVTTDNGSVSWAERGGQLSPDGRYHPFI